MLDSCAEAIVGIGKRLEQEVGEDRARNLYLYLYLHCFAIGSQ